MNDLSDGKRKTPTMYSRKRKKKSFGSRNLPLEKENKIPNV
jgi:hypothetical protein